MNAGTPQGLWDCSMTFNASHLSICSSITNQLASEPEKGNKEISLFPSLRGILTLAG